MLVNHQTPEARAAYNRAYYSDPANAAKRWARDKINNLLRAGKLARHSCEVCGISETQAHHDDYSKPLDVRWLCRPCHKAVHHKVECKRGHRRTPDNLDQNSDCKQCRRERASKSKQSAA